MPGELPLALALHYAIGVALTCAFLGLLASCPDAPPKAFSWALAFGLFTNLLPWLVMFPSMGFGVLGLRGPSELLLLRLCWRRVGARTANVLHSRALTEAPAAETPWQAVAQSR